MRGSGLSIEILTEYVTMFQQGNDTVKARKELLIEQRNLLDNRIKEMQKTLERLDNKIDGYEEKFLKHEENLRK